VRVRDSVLIAREPSDVFAFVTDPANDMRWRSMLTGSHASPEAPAVGSHIWQSYSYQGRAVELELEVTESTPPERIRYRAVGKIKATADFSCVAENGGTRFAIALTGEIPGFAALFASRIERELSAALKTDVERLKSVLEPGR
jgi:carbon monoxide dehydrogenase subunit G